MMEGFPLDMTEDDVGSKPQQALSSVISYCRGQWLTSIP